MPRPRPPDGGVASAVGAGAGLAGMGIAVVMKILSPQMTGEELPLPGISCFQATCSVSLQVSGASPRAMPLSAGPRQRGQSSSPERGAEVAGAIKKVVANNRPNQDRKRGIRQKA